MQRALLALTAAVALALPTAGTAAKPRKPCQRPGTSTVAHNSLARVLGRGGRVRNGAPRRFGLPRGPCGAAEEGEMADGSLPRRRGGGPRLAPGGHRLETPQAGPAARNVDRRAQPAGPRVRARGARPG